ncbi:class I SAM-dependent methyltransferase [Parendozoicomonas haliclonae]|uniref:Putative methyltransferase YcgJ n=1 Tax=Parendozoicomonas haliclonae TaxID=1960125 RepID=A0A1X7APH0_9GAMM|nr:class I SAM-dependent methyltransferase [Parendozoicomonas haliclonae]SMA50221.1 putative methyltransferase YcgJ [Parendozoicomonas haliclonae]
MLYDKYVLPVLLNFACSRKSINKKRSELVQHAKGRVLEIGFGTGLNLDFYQPDNIDTVIALEPCEEMLKKSQGNIKRSVMAIELMSQPAEKIPLQDNSVDTVLSTYTLCTICDWSSALSEIRRVLKPEGQFLFVEHGLAPDTSVRNWQTKINPVWRRLFGGCNLDRNIIQMIKGAGFDIERLEEEYVQRLPKIAGFTYLGAASKGQ